MTANFKRLEFHLVINGREMVPTHKFFTSCTTEKRAEEILQEVRMWPNVETVWYVPKGVACSPT